MGEWVDERGTICETESEATCGKREGCSGAGLRIAGLPYHALRPVSDLGGN